jgi:hypothetical protein
MRHLFRRLRLIRAASQEDLAQAVRVTVQSRQQAKEDLSTQRDLLKHEQANIVAPLRDERVRINHLSVLARQALRGE